MSPEDLADHVSHLYLNGPGGILRERMSKIAYDSQMYLRELDRHPALVLNADYQPMSFLPLSMWHWQEAIKSVFSGKVTVVDVYDDVTIRGASIAIPLPSVMLSMNMFRTITSGRPSPNVMCFCATNIAVSIAVVDFTQMISALITSFRAVEGVGFIGKTP